MRNFLCHNNTTAKFGMGANPLVGKVYKCLIVCVLFITSCDIPQDSSSTFEIARKSSLKIGVVSNPPFSELEGDFSGTEIDILQQFAEAKNLKLHFSTGSESALISMLETGELHVVIGGFEKETLWKERAGLTSPYDESHVMLVQKGENRLVYELESFFNTYIK
jgi:membrane-bound lytic murein transglycosylase MltF